MKALIRIAPKFRPVSGDLQGYRIQACVPNTAGRKMVRTKNGFRATQEEVPAFRRPYLIAESMDYTTEGQITDAEMARFKQKLAWEGFDAYELIVREDKSSAKLDAATKAKIDDMLARLGFNVN